MAIRRGSERRVGAITQALLLWVTVLISRVAE